MHVLARVVQLQLTISGSNIQLGTLKPEVANPELVEGLKNVWFPQSIYSVAKR